MSYIISYLASSRQFLVPIPDSRELSSVVYGGHYTHHYAQMFFLFFFYFQFFSRQNTVFLNLLMTWKNSVSTDTVSQEPFISILSIGFGYHLVCVLYTTELSKQKIHHYAWTFFMVFPTKKQTNFWHSATKANNALTIQTLSVRQDSLPFYHQIWMKFVMRLADSMRMDVFPSS